jgi:hypothetical protein
MGTQGGSVSEYGELVPFTTGVVPCEISPPILVSVRIFLDGAYNASNQLMADSLRVKGMLPLQEPYTAMGFALTAMASTTPAVLATTGGNAIVDWVLLELRSPIDPAQVLETRAGLLQRDGDIVRPDGGPYMAFCSPGGQQYHLSIRHRNHLGCMTATAQVLGTAPASLHFSEGLGTYGIQAVRQRAGVQLLWAGNTVFDNEILYTGGENDRDAILQAIGGVVPTNTVTGYRFEDCDLDGVVKYTGSNNDRDLILNTVGGVVPTTTRSEQIP